MEIIAGLLSRAVLEGDWTRRTVWTQTNLTEWIWNGDGTETWRIVWISPYVFFSSWAAGSVTEMTMFSVELVTYWWSRRSQFFDALFVSLAWWDESGKTLKTQEMKLAGELLSLCWRNFKRLFGLWFGVCSFSYRGNQPRRCKSCGVLRRVGWFNS